MKNRNAGTCVHLYSGEQMTRQFNKTAANPAKTENTRTEIKINAVATHHQKIAGSSISHKIIFNSLFIPV